MRPGDIVTNALTRPQEESKHQKSTPTSACDKYINKHCLISPTNTVIPIEMIQQHRAAWQALLETIADFLILGQGVWWRILEDGNIEFF